MNTLEAWTIARSDSRLTFSDRVVLAEITRSGRTQSGQLAAACHRTAAQIHRNLAALRQFGYINAQAPSNLRERRHDHATG